MRLHQRAKDPLDNLTIYPWTWNKEVKKDGTQINHVIYGSIKNSQSIYQRDEERQMSI